jgi:hypothetical protein
MQINLVEELEGILASKNISRRAEILRRVTDLFVVGSGRFSEDQVELFDDVMASWSKMLSGQPALSLELAWQSFRMLQPKSFANLPLTTRSRLPDQCSCRANDSMIAL